MRIRTLAPLAIALSVATTLALAPTASAEPDPSGCPKENFCIYAGEGQTGTVLVRTPNNWTGSVSGKSFFNNGIPFPNEDHIQLTWTYGGRTHEKCFHYNPGPGEYKADFLGGVVFTKATWRGEC
ncbi:hypothetical protein [Streptomyces sp. NPDC101181]|uniref:hypothetical protein n=1 Tax=Streptomyces sp. NPDC101181 TaxID=3366125 RepID=UPI0037F4AB03